MVKRRVILTFTENLLKEPIVYSLGQQFEITTNIQLADISEDRGWVILDLEGEEKDINEAITWVTSRGIRTELIDDEETRLL